MSELLFVKNAWRFNETETTNSESTIYIKNNNNNDTIS